MIIVLSPPSASPLDIKKYNTLFSLGLHSLHLRLPNASKDEYKECIKAISPEYRKRIIISDYFELVREAGLGGIHLKKERWGEWKHWQGAMGGRVSISAHSIKELEELPFRPTYALLSPVYDSFSKENYKGNINLNLCKKVLPQLNFPVLALGGINPQRAKEITQFGFSGVAVLGYLSKNIGALKENFLKFPLAKVLSIAGHDPTSGAGIISDALTIQSIGAYPFTICSTITEQNEENFKGDFSVPSLSSLSTLLEKHSFNVAKIGMISSLKEGIGIAKMLKKANIKNIIWDPIIAASAGTENILKNISQEEINEMLSLINIITPNFEEAKEIFGTTDLLPLALSAAEYKTAILLKGGHNLQSKLVSSDELILPSGKTHKFTIARSPFDKHGTGCVLSSAIASYISLGYTLTQACQLGQSKVDEFRRSSSDKLGVHHSNTIDIKKEKISRTKIQYITDSEDIDELISKCRAALEGGIRWIQLRMKNASPEKRKEAAFTLKKIMLEYENSILIINDDLELALSVDADGIHLGLKDISPVIARKVLGINKIIGGTCNTINDLDLRSFEGVDYIGVGPYKGTNTKQLLSPILGKEGIEKIVLKNKQLPHPIPLFAIGGIKKDDIEDLVKLGVEGIALSGAINNAKQIEVTSKDLNSFIERIISNKKTL